MCKYLAPCHKILEVLGKKCRIKCDFLNQNSQKMMMDKVTVMTCDVKDVFGGRFNDMREPKVLLHPPKNGFVFQKQPNLAQN